jgi:hypothetical protein
MSLRSKSFIMPLVVIMLIVSFSSLAFAGNKVVVGRVVSTDSTLLMNANASLPAQLSMTGFSVVSNRNEAKYEINANIIGDVNRKFNVWILLLWLWPVVPFSTQDAVVNVNLKVVDVATGEEVCNVIGSNQQKTGLFGDFTSSESILKKAMDNALINAITQLPASIK